MPASLHIPVRRSRHEFGELAFEVMRQVFSHVYLL
jgi:hypothetical protein